tara:strand:+ start:1358 stop:1825 length:468 start_codon:yes stop_codon:yes gene_type:complete
MTNHLNKKNKPQIVDISNKKNSERGAKAEAIISFSPSIFKKIQKMETKKGSIENVAILAGIMGAKDTSKIIPLCHSIPINHINIDIKKLEKSNSLKIISHVKTNSKTGVEMEALVAVTISSLTIYDMCKNLSKNIVIKNIKLISKYGGKSDYKIK